jgi:hypothetical protein
MRRTGMTIAAIVLMAPAPPASRGDGLPEWDDWALIAAALRAVPTPSVTSHNRHSGLISADRTARLHKSD